MQQSLMIFIFGLVAFFLCCSLTSSSVISCPPNGFQQELNPKLSQLCLAIEQALSDSTSQNEGYVGRLVDERNTNLNAKRQDVDHVFLRFGRRFGL